MSTANTLSLCVLPPKSSLVLFFYYFCFPSQLFVTREQQLTELLLQRKIWLGLPSAGRLRALLPMEESERESSSWAGRGRGRGKEKEEKSDKKPKGKQKCGRGRKGWSACPPTTWTRTCSRRPRTPSGGGRAAHSPARGEGAWWSTCVEKSCVSVWQVSPKRSTRVGGLFSGHPARVRKGTRLDPEGGDDRGAGPVVACPGLSLRGRG